jgi:hypothetical protein
MKAIIFSPHHSFVCNPPIIYVYPACPVKCGADFTGVKFGLATAAYLSAGILADFTGELSAKSYKLRYPPLLPSTHTLSFLKKKYKKFIHILAF